MEDDERFAHISKDPRFKKIPNRKRKVKIDSRFQQMFTDKNFNTKYFVDKRGRKVKDSANEDLTHFYNLSDKDDEVVEKTEINKTQSKKRGNNVETLEKDEGRKREKSKKGRAKEGNKSYEEKEIVLSDEEKEITLSDEEKEITLSDEEKEIMLSDEKKEIMLSDEEEEITLSDEEKEIMLSDKETAFHNKQTGNEIDSWHELKENVAVVEDATSRLALCNMDWDKITADDLFVLFHSFLPSGGIIYSVKIYPSDYGLERMKREDEIGPTELVSVGNVSDEDMPDKDNDYNQERLRQYQLNRLRYYYAVLQCNSPVTAETIYEECDGMEYEASSSHLDLRFIPDDMVFVHKPTSLATTLPSAETYKPSEFITTALQQSTVKLTWDETDPKRVQTTMRNFSKDDLLDMDFKAYLASSSGEEESEGEDENKKEDQDLKIAKYKVLLEELQKKEEGSESEMTVTWEVGLKETTEELVKRKKNEREQDQLTPWENYLVEKKNKKRERRQHKENESEPLAQVDNEEIPADVDLNDPFFAEELEKTESNLKEKSSGNKKRKRGSEQRETEEDKRKMAELQLLLMEDDDGKKHFNLKSIMKDERKKKMKKKGEETQKDDFKIDLNDSRFSALYSSHYYAVDPSDPQFKRTKAMDSIIKEKQRRSDSINKNDLKNQDDKATVEVDTLDTTVENSNTVNPSLSSLIKNIKSNASKFQNKRNINFKK